MLAVTRREYAVMKLMPLAALAAMLAGPAHAQVAHQSSITHEGRSYAVNYEPQVETKLRQTGIGPRSTASCRWTSEVSVRRTAMDPQMQPIAALSRVIEGSEARNGSQLGLCSTVSKRTLTAFAGDEQKLRGWLAEVAARDADALRGEFASLNAMHSGHAYAR